MNELKVLPQCAQECVINEGECSKEQCKHWISYGEDLNCSLVSIEKNGRMTLQQIADRLGVSVVRVLQIERKAKSKLKKQLIY